MPLRPPPPRRLRRLISLSPLRLLICGALLLLADWACRRSGDSFFPGAPLDESAHFLTALLLLQLLPAGLRTRFAGPALVASVAIDLDHVPQYLGYGFLSAGAPRPYTHSLLTALVLGLLALSVRRERRIFTGLALGVALHFVRDLGEGTGSAVPLLWPLSDHGYSYPHAAYLAIIAAACLVGLLRPRARVPAALRPPARRRPASRASA